MSRVAPVRRCKSNNTDIRSWLTSTVGGKTNTQNDGLTNRHERWTTRASFIVSFAYLAQTAEENEEHLKRNRNTLFVVAGAGLVLQRTVDYITKRIIKTDIVAMVTKRKSTCTIVRWICSVLLDDEAARTNYSANKWKWREQIHNCTLLRTRALSQENEGSIGS